MKYIVKKYILVLLLLSPYGCYGQFFTENNEPQALSKNKTNLEDIEILNAQNSISNSEVNSNNVYEFDILDIETGLIGRSNGELFIYIEDDFRGDPSNIAIDNGLLFKRFSNSIGALIVQVSTADDFENISNSLTKDIRVKSFFLDVYFGQISGQ